MTWFAGHPVLPVYKVIYLAERVYSHGIKTTFLFFLAVHKEKCLFVFRSSIVYADNTIRH